MEDNTVKWECTVDGEWQAGYLLTQESIKLIYRFADLLQLEENDEIVILDLLHELERAHEKANS